MQTNAQYNAESIHTLIINTEPAYDELQSQLIAYMLKNRPEKYIHWQKFTDIINMFADGYYSKITMTALLRNEYKEVREYHRTKLQRLSEQYTSQPLCNLYWLTTNFHNFKFAEINTMLLNAYSDMLTADKPYRQIVNDCKYILELQKVIQTRIIVISGS